MSLETLDGPPAEAGLASGQADSPVLAENTTVGPSEEESCVFLSSRFEY